MAFLKCKDCDAWRKIDGEPEEPKHRFCMLFPRQVVVGPSATIGSPDNGDRVYHVVKNFASVYPVHHRQDGCFYGVPKESE